tara:strand:- start:1597 stop:3426 length:1830 start_codon:yes stop_codon:yes gene_type:complete
MAKEGTITPVELISTAPRGGYSGNYSIDAPSMAENAARGDQIDSQLRATIAEGAEAEQREERQRKCAEQGLVYNETTGSCLDPALNDLISGNINPASNDIPNGNITFEDLTLGADASITGTKAIEDFLTTLANDAAFGDLVQSAGIASSIAGNNAANVVQTPGFAPLETAGAAVETVGNMQIPGVLDIPGVGPVIEQGAETLAGFIDDIVDLTGVFRGWGKDVVLGTGGARVTVRPPNTRPATQPGGGPQVGSAGNTTVTIDTGSPEGNVIAQGGSVAGIADVLSGGSGEGTITQSEIIMRAACAAQGKEYSPYSNMCVSKKPDASTNTPGINPNPGGIIPAGTGTAPPAGAGTGNESTGGNTTVGVTTSKHPCEDPAYAGNPRNFVECAAYMATKNNDTPAPPTAGITVVGPGGDGTAPAGGVGPVPAAVDPCDKPEYKAANPVECGVIGPDPDPDPETSAVVPPVVPPVVDPCNDPDYAVANPAICGGTGIPNPCDDLDYAAANPEQCGGGLNFCDDPDYAAANPEECGGGLTLCGDEVFAMLNPDICNAAPGFTMPGGGGGGSYISVTPGEVADIGYYDVNTPSGVFGNKGSGNLVSEIEAILKGR